MRSRSILLALLIAAAAIAACLPQYAAAEATIGPEPTPGPSGLPDGRVYEQVSPPFKNGNYVAYGKLYGRSDEFGLASADGNAVVYPASGAFGESYSGIQNDPVSRRTSAHGWQTFSTTSRPLGEPAINTPPEMMIPSAAFTHFLFISQWPFNAQDIRSGSDSGANVFLSDNPAREATWLGRPQITEPLPAVGEVPYDSYYVTGASPNLDTVYFIYTGTLTPEDASRAPNVAIGKSGGSPGSRDTNPWGFYEWKAGHLVSAGALPNGSYSPFGAVPAGLAGETINKGRIINVGGGANANMVSEDGSRALFVSPDPGASSITSTTTCAKEPPCSTEAPQLYDREIGSSGGKSSVLVSRSELPGHEGEPAPDGVSFVGKQSGYGTPDGSQVFFASTARLTQSAPANEAVKEYDFDVASETLTYLPDIVGPIAGVSHEGAEVFFTNTAVSPHRLELWRRGSGGGTVTAITAWSGGGGIVSRDGSVFVFTASGEIPGFNDSGGFAQIYRYDVASTELTCVSCPGPGQAPTGNARIGREGPGGSPTDPATTRLARGISEDGSRIFFDTPSALVSQDTNGQRDVYEWENGTVYLISAGTSNEPSYYIDNGAKGENVFFNTSAALVPGDTDEAYDVYDARMPRPGDNPPPAATACRGAVCQGPPSTPQLLGAPPTATLTGPGNLTPKPPAKHEAKHGKRLTRKQRLRRALKVCKRRHRHSRRKRRRCKRGARRRYGAKAAARHHHGGRRHKGNGRHNRRGK